MDPDPRKWYGSGFVTLLPIMIYLTMPHIAKLKLVQPVLRIQTLLIRIRILLFTLIRIWILFFNLIPIRIWLFDPDPNPYRFEEVVMYLKRYFLYIFTWFILSVGPAGPTQKAFFVNVSLPVNFGVLSRKMIRIQIRNTGYNNPFKILWSDVWCRM